MYNNRGVLIALLVVCLMLLLSLFDATKSVVAGILVSITIVLFSATIAYLLNFTLRSLEHVFYVWTKRKRAATILGYLLGFVMLIIAALIHSTATLPRLGNEISDLIERLPVIKSELTETTGINKVFLWGINAIESDVLRTAKVIFATDSYLAISRHLLIALPALIIGFLFSRGLIKKKINTILSALRLETKFKILAAFSGADALIREHFNVRLLFGGLLGGVFFVVYDLFNLPYNALLSTAMGMLSLCPYFGAILALFCAIILAFLSSGILNFQLIILGVILITTYEICVAYFAPTKLNVSPIFVLILAVFGSFSLGAIGIVVLPIIGALLYYATDLIFRLKAGKPKRN